MKKNCIFPDNRISEKNGIVLSFLQISAKRRHLDSLRSLCCNILHHLASENSTYTCKIMTVKKADDTLVLL